MTTAIPSKKDDLDMFIRRIEDFASNDMDDSWYDAKRMRGIFCNIIPLLKELAEARAGAGSKG